MMFPAPVNGAMPFVDSKKYREQQIKKVIAKHKSRHNSGPDKYSLEKSRVHNSKSAKSMPQLTYKDSLSLSPRMRRPQYNSMPSLESRLDISKIESSSPEDKKLSIVKAIKHLFMGKKDKKKATKRYIPLFTPNSNSRARSSSAPVDILCKSRCDVNSESHSPPGVSPKRQRTRTVSNISSIMETIDEIPENLVLEDESDTDSDDDSCCAASSSDNQSVIHSLSSLLSSASEPVLRRNSTSHSHLLHLRATDSKESLVLSSNEVICAA